jgi:hypothetical protein
MPTIVTREYNPSTGALIGNISQLNFGRIPVGAHSSIKAIDFAFSGVSSVSDVKLGLMSSGGVTPNDSPTGLTADGSASNGRFGVEHSTSFTAKTTLTRHFAGINTSNNASDPNNVEIGTRDDTTSQFTYLNIELGSENTGDGAGNYKVFFDFT